MNKRPPKRDYKPPVTSKALALWRECVMLEREGREDELLQAGKRLAVACGLDWCSMSWPTTVKRPDPPPHVARSVDDLAICWAEAWRARCALIEAAAADLEND